MRVLLAMLGASQFPRRLDLSSPAFAQSHRVLRDWLLDNAYGPMIAGKDCLDLFDSPRSWPDQEAELADWLADRTATQPAPTDLIVHYVGHGGFRDESRDYYLAIRTTRADNPFYSSIMVDSLWRTLRSGGRRQRRFLIIDACFAAAAARALMAPLQEAVKVKVRDLQEAEGAESAHEGLSSPDRGTAVLCSSSAQDPASLAGAGGITQFTDGLMHVLAAGSEAANDRLSFAQVHALVKASLSARYKENAVAPELHAPDQRLGLPQDVPIFPNVVRMAAPPSLVEIGVLLAEFQTADLEATLPQIFRALVHVDAAGRPARQRASKIELMALPLPIPQLIERLIEGRVLLGQGSDAEATVTLVHEALLQEWPILKQWLEFNRPRMQRIQALLQLLSPSEPSDSRRYAIARLGTIGLAVPEVVTALLTMLQDADESVRRMATEVVGRIGPSEGDVLPTLVSALQSTSENIRRAAARALGRIGAARAEALPGLIAVLQNDVESVRSTAAEALGRIGDAAVIALPSLNEIQHNDVSRNVRSAAAEAIEQIRPAATESVSALHRAINVTNLDVQTSVHPTGRPINRRRQSLKPPTKPLR